MPTGRGWAALGAAAALVLLWVGFGERELLAAGVFLFFATLTGVFFVRRVAPRIDVRRRLAPEQVHEGDRAIVDLTVSARGAVRNLMIEDEVQGLGAARFAAARLDRDTAQTARYEVLCRPRGIYRVGPATAVVSDVLGLAEADTTVGGVDRLVVYPAVEDLEGYPIVRGHDPSVQASRPQHSQVGGEDFFTLREYQHGDDLRKVHWPSSAKRDELMIRQLEIPWQSRALVLLDHRRAVFPSDAAFEHAVRGAASVIRHLYRGGFSPDLWTLEARAHGRVQDRYRDAMERLATVRVESGVDLRRAVVRMQKKALAGGALVLVTGIPDEQDLAAYRTLARDFTRTLVLAVGAEGDAEVEALRRAGVVTVVVESGAPWSPAWRDAMERTWSTATLG